MIWTCGTGGYHSLGVSRPGSPEATASLIFVIHMASVVSSLTVVGRVTGGFQWHLAWVPPTGHWERCFCVKHFHFNESDLSVEPECFAENLLCWKTPSHVLLSYSHGEEMRCLQPLLPLLMFQPPCASPCAHSGSISQRTHLLISPNILYWEVHEIFKRYKEKETVLLQKRDTVQMCDGSTSATE